MTREELNSATDTLLDDNKPEGSILPSDDAELRKLGYDYTDQEIAALNASKASLESVNAALATKASITYVDTEIDAAVASVFKFSGNWDASGGTFPTTGSGTAGAIDSGNLYKVSGAGTMGGEPYSVGDYFVALVDNPGQTAGNWDKFNYNADEATIDTLGLVRYASDAEADSGTGTGLPNVTQVQGMIDNSPASVGYTEYVAHLVQSGTTAPVATILKNTTSLTPVFGAPGGSAGRYPILLSGATMTKVSIDLSPRTASAKRLAWDYSVSGTTVTLRTYNEVNSAYENDMMPGNIITIRVYP